MIRPLAAGAIFAACLLSGRWGFAANPNEFAVFSLTEGASTLLRGRLYVPPEASNPEPRPLILFLHGAGESGANNTAQVNANIDNLLREAKRRGAFLYAPQTNNGWGNALTNSRVMAMIDQALANYNVDDERLYVTGLSMGGGGTWNILHDYGDRFAAGVPICAVAPNTGYQVANLVDEPIWAFHARNDGTVSVNTTRTVFNNLLAADGQGPPTYLTTRDLVDSHFASSVRDIQYTEYYTGNHGIWGRVYNTPAMYDWMFAHAVPEPSAAAAMGIALAALVPRLRRRTG
jgi:predicted peptidase